MNEEYVKQLVMARLKTIPPNVSFSVGPYGNFTRDDIIKQVDEGTPIGREFAKIELRMLVDSPRLAGRFGGKATSPDYS